MKTNRRNFIKRSTCALATVPVISNALAEAPGSSRRDVLKGFIVSDAHFGWKHPTMQPTPQKQRELIAHIHERFPDLDVWIDTGDAHHSSLGAKEAFDAATRDWCDIIANQSNKALFFYVPGNHEICGPTAGQDSERRCARMGSMSYRPYYSYDVKGIHFVSVPELEHPAYVNKETLDWLKLDLDLNRDKTVILLSHNNVKGTTHFDDSFMEGYRGVSNSDALMDVINRHPNVISWMHGHNHDYVIAKKDDRLFVSNGRIGGFDPKHAYKDGEPLGGIYFEVTPDQLIVRCYSAEHQMFIDEGMGRPGRSQTLNTKTTVNASAPTNYAFGHGGFVDGQRAAIYNYNTSKDSLCSLVLAGTDDACINENIHFSEYTHRNDSPTYKQWDVFGFKVTHNGWPRYFEEKNEVWRWLNPGVLLLPRDTAEQATSLHLPAPEHGPTMYYRAVSGKPYFCGLTLSSGQGGQQVELHAKAYSQDGKQLWKTVLPKQTVAAGEQLLTFGIDVPELDAKNTIYDNQMFDTEIQLAVELRVTSLLNELTLKETVFERAGSGGNSKNPELVFDGHSAGKSGALSGGQTCVKSLAKPSTARWTVEGSCGGSHRFLWYCRQTNIDWQVRNAPVADRGNHLAIEAPTNTWSTDQEIVILPTPGNTDEIYVNRMRNISAARIWPLNRGNDQVGIEMLSGAGTGSVEICSPSRPADVTGAKSWTYKDGVILVQLTAGTRATIAAG
jgi:hypothetical protein